MLLKQSAVLFTICQKNIDILEILSEQKKYCLQINEYWINKNACLNTVLINSIIVSHNNNKKIKWLPCNDDKYFGLYITGHYNPSVKITV